MVQQVSATPAWQVMTSFNPNALAAWEGGKEVFIEDWRDPDGRIYRLEYRADLQGRDVQAFCLYSPWPAGRFEVNESHLYSDGRLCLGPHDKRFRLDEAIQRARYWCTAYSVLHESGRFPDPVGGA